MKFRIFFSISKTERKLKLVATKKSSKAGFLSFKKKEEQNAFIQALFYPEVEERILKLCKRLGCRALKFFTIEFENVEIRGSLGDPFYDSIAFGMSGGCYYPNWEEESGNWSAKGYIILKSGILRLIFFVFSTIYEISVLAFLLWRGTRLAKKNPNGENLGTIRKWIFLKISTF